MSLKLVWMWAPYIWENTKLICYMNQFISVKYMPNSYAKFRTDLDWNATRTLKQKNKTIILTFLVYIAVALKACQSWKLVWQLKWGYKHVKFENPPLNSLQVHYLMALLWLAANPKQPDFLSQIHAEVKKVFCPWLHPWK